MGSGRESAPRRALGRYSEFRPVCSALETHRGVPRGGMRKELNPNIERVSQLQQPKWMDYQSFDFQGGHQTRRNWQKGVDTHHPHGLWEDRLCVPFAT